MPAPKGTIPPNAGKGRPRGPPNKATRDVRNVFSAFVEANAEKAQALFDKGSREGSRQSAGSARSPRGVRYPEARTHRPYRRCAIVMPSKGGPHDASSNRILEGQHARARPQLRPCARGGGLPSGQAEVLQRSASHPATDLRFNEQFEYLNVVKVNLILFNFAN
jgi:hypothetical protein